jgi:hypothetical protein
MLTPTLQASYIAIMHAARVSKLSLLCRFLPLIVPRPQLVIHGVLASRILFNLRQSRETDSEIIGGIFPLAHASKLPSVAMRVQGHPCACFRISLPRLHSLTRTKSMRLMRLGSLWPGNSRASCFGWSVLSKPSKETPLWTKNCTLSSNPLSSLTHIST